MSEENQQNDEVPLASESQQAEAAFEEATRPSEHAQKAEAAQKRQKKTREAAAAKVRSPSRKPKKEKTFLIKLHNNSEIPPGGQYVGVNGRWILLIPNREIEVPESALEVLDNAIRLEAEKDEHNRVVGRREVPRFPYTFVRRPRE